MVYKFLDETSKDGSVNNEIKQNEQLAEELQKPIIKKLKKTKIYSSFKGNAWGADLADIQLISKFNKGTRILLCVTDIFSKYAWVVPLKDKKFITIVNAIQNILDNSTKLHSIRKPNKIWADKNSEFYNSSFKKWLKYIDIELYSRHNEGKSVVAERSIKTLKNKIYKHMTAVSKNHISISKYQNIFAKRYTPNWFEEVFVIKEATNTVPWTYFINDLNDKEVIETFYEKEL